MEKSTTQGKGKRTVKNLLITLVFGLVYFYAKLPAINLHDSAFYTFVLLLAAVYCFLSILTQGLFKAESGRELWQSVKTHCTIPVFLCIILAVIFIIGSLISSPIIRAGAYRSLITVETGDFAAEVDQISFNQIPMLDEASAMKLGDKKMGELADIVSQFQVADDYTQINYNGRPVRVTPLYYSDMFKWLTNRGDGLPAYIIIDMVTQDTEVVRLEEGMKYTTTEYLFRNVERHLRINYPTYMFNTANFEIDDEGVPYWVCPRIVKKVGLFGGTDINGAVLMNAITGECTYYIAEEVPDWVDRVYSASLIMNQYDYYGMYQNGWLNSFIGQRGVTITSDGYNYIAKDGCVYLYTGITSVVSDNSNIGFILTNQRTKETKYYPCAGAQEKAAMSSAEGIVQYMDYVATFPLLLNISNQPTYFMALKDSGGLVKMYAMVNVQQYQLVASGTTVAECERNYVNLMAGSNLADTGELEGATVKGTIEDIRTAVIDGNTSVFIKLEGDDYYYIISVSDAKLAAVLSVGDRVEVTPSSDDGELRSAYNVVRLS
ncbi:MAG: CvpA family protein [Oscillospiraceae bacterium]|nr:CvpA family protein [Oscillospiraceae bacterium]